MKKHPLLKDLQHEAALLLHRTSSVPQSLQKSDKFELLALAFGRATVVADFRVWCAENKENPPKYPITTYLRVVDDRLGAPTGETKVDADDPRIQPLAATIYDLAGYAPSRKQIATLLAEFSVADIIEALKEFCETLNDGTHESGMRRFFGDGGCAVVIYARQHRAN